MTKKEKIGLSLFVATLVAVLDIFHRKFGGHISGGRFSHSHTWIELKEFIPEFFGYFFITFAGMAIYQLMEKQKDVICPNCEESFKSLDLKNAVCPKCGTPGEKLEGFYQNHPELLKEKKT